MPLYEYLCEQDGTVIELIRPMASADDPVEDPDGNGRSFARKLSTFQHKTPTPMPSGMPGGCGCGNPHGPCNMG